MKKMRLRYAGACRLCSDSVQAGTEAIYESDTKTVRCLECATETPETAPHLERVGYNSLSTESGIAGSSARREYERRKAKDEEKLREKWGPFGGIAVAVSDERQSTKAWDRGAIGEDASAPGWMPWPPMAWLSFTIDASPDRRPTSTTLPSLPVESGSSTPNGTRDGPN
jgi:hypothetical protein